MAEKFISEPDGSGKQYDHNFSSIPDEQLFAFLKGVRREIKRRIQDKRSREDFVAKLIAAGEEVPENYFKIVGEDKSAQIPRSLREEHLKVAPTERIKYLKALIQQDWSHLWFGRDEERKYCVYAHVNPKGKWINFPSSLGGMCRMPFYIGKGTLARANDLNRNQGHGLRIRQLLSIGFSKADMVHIIRDNLMEAEALELESKLIYFFGTIYEPRRRGVLLNLDISLRPKFERSMIRIESPKQQVA